jgi:hypothetical protein
MEERMDTINHVGARFWLAGILLLPLYGCGASDPAADRSESALSASDCNVASPGAGWQNQPVPESAGLFSASWRTYPSTRPLDGIMGFSNGPADGFTDLGPIVRFATSGYIDARDGASYGGFGFPYTSGDGPYEFQLRVDVAAHRYSAWVRHLDAPYKPFELLGQDLAFRTEQASVTRLDNWGAFLDGANGNIQSCRFAYNPTNGCVQSKDDGVWQSRPFDARLAQNQAHVDLFAWVDASGVDGVIGVANGVPTAFNQLAAAVRFRPDGRMDVRNGAAYAADAELTYVPNTYYAISMDLDLTRSTYSVTVTQAGQNVFTNLARDYAFRTEQAGVANVDHVGQVVDGTPGTLNTCAMRAL